MAKPTPIARLGDLTSLARRARQDLAELAHNQDPEQRRRVDDLGAALASLEQGLARYLGVFQRAVQGIFIATPEGKPIDCNPAFARMLGYDHPEDLLRLDPFPQVHFFDPAEREVVIRLLLERGELINQEVRMRHLDGSEIWTLVNLRLTRGGLIEGISVDVTAQKETEAALRQSQADYREMVEASAEGFVYFGPDLRVQDCNRAYHRMLGYTRQEIIGKQLLELADPTSRDFLEANKERFLHQEQRRFETRLLARDGHLVPVLIQGHTHRDAQGRVKGHVAFVTDQSDQKQALQLAAEVQRSLLPQGQPCVTGLDVAAKSEPSQDVGGDYYDWLCGSDIPGRALDLVVGDLSGHGVDAALLMTSARAWLRASAGSHQDLDQVVAEANQHLCREMGSSGRFMTLVYLTMFPQEGRLCYVRAGHDPVMILDPLAPEDSRWTELDQGGLPLGVDPLATHEVYRLEGLRPGQVLVLGSDGVWESTNTAGEMYGKRRVMERVAAAAGGTAQDMLASVWNDLTSFTRGTVQADDRTLVVVKVLEPHQTPWS